MVTALGMYLTKLHGKHHALVSGEVVTSVNVTAGQPVRTLFNVNYFCRFTSLA